jgi:hypothetical protein
VDNKIKYSFIAGEENVNNINKGSEKIQKNKKAKILEAFFKIQNESRKKSIS